MFARANFYIGGVNMKKEYTKPIIDVKEFDVENNIADISMGANTTLNWNDNAGDSVEWE